MRGARLMAGVCGALATLAFAVPSALAVGGPANWMYEPTSFTEVHLTLPPASIAELEAEPKEYVEGTFSLAETDGTPGTAGPFSAPLTVGIELKGNLGSLRSVNQKAAFKIKFGEYVKGQRFLGLEKMTLNNMVEDPSMIHEATTYQAFHEMGVPAPHVGYAYLTVNGKSYGLHLNIETQDAQSLENEFGTTFAEPQHLYAGEYGADVDEEPLPSNTAEKKWEGLEVSEGKKSKKEDLEALVAAVVASSPAFSPRVGPFADLTEMTKNWLVEKYVGNWDGYAGDPVDYYHPNNYYLYSDSSGLFQMMPWGTDETWESGRHLAFGSDGGVLFTDCVADTAACGQSYLAAGREALTALNATTLDTVARCTAGAVQSWQKLEAAISEQEKLPDPSLTRNQNLQKAAAEASATREFIASRPAELATFLGEPAPPPRTTEPACPALRTILRAGAAGGAGTGTPAAGAPAPTAGHPILAWARRVLPAHAGGPAAISLTVPGPGRVTLRGTYGKPSRAACHGTTAVTSAREVTVTCHLTRSFAMLLARHGRRIHLEARFASATGGVEAIARSVELRRWPTHPSSS